ncbi:MAG: nitrate ABC transporter substrate-binding protein [Desulfobacteraceae bacterium IS3]|nr:MAG: nitrate ABC transporter substrate-binding protein [Desulfobacteraceae bacterium IS3]
MLKKIWLIIAVIITMSLSAHAEEKINYRLKWLFNTSAVGDLYADTGGFFKRNGLDVSVKAGGPERDAIRELELGHADFGVASADQVIRAVSKGSPIIVIAQLFQINPLQWIYRAAKPPIKTPADLKGRVIGITYGGNDEIIMRTLLAKAGLTERDVKFYSVRYDYTPFYQDKTELWPVYRNAQGPILEDKSGKEALRYFNPADFGIRFAANSVITSARMLKEHPETVKKFANALLDGWQAAVDPVNTAKALKILEQSDRDTPSGIREKQLTLTREIVKPEPASIVGKIDIQAWTQTEKIMLDQKQIPKPVFIEKVLSDATIPNH